MTTQSDKLPPHSPEAEKAVIGSLLIHSETMTAVSLALTAADFFREPNRWVFEACTAAYLRGEALNQITVAAELERMGKLEEVGGAAYLAGCVADVPTSLYAEGYAKEVHGCAVNRQLIQVAGKLAQLGYDNRANVERTLEEAERLVAGLREGSSVKGLVHIKSIVEDYLSALMSPPAEKEKKKPLSTGIYDLDRLLGGLHATDLIIVAARPRIGKSALLLNLASTAAIGQGKRVAIFSVEMAKEQLLERLLAARALVDSQHIRRGEMDAAEERAVIHAAGQLADAGIWIDDSSSISSTAIRSKSRLLASQHGLDLVIVDYLQILDGDGKTDNRSRELGEMTKTLKGLAKELQIPVLAAAQLNRGIEYRKPPKPMLADLRESGSLESDADVVMFLYCEDPDTRPDGRVLDVAKHRHGAQGQVPLRFVGEHTRFHGITDKEPQQEVRQWWVEPF